MVYEVLFLTGSKITQLTENSMLLLIMYHLLSLILTMVYLDKTNFSVFGAGKYHIN